MNVFRFVIPALTVLLQLTLIGLLLKRPVRQYPVLLIYGVVYISVVFLEGMALSGPGASSALYRDLYWTSELILDFLLFLMVITMTNRALEGSPLRPAVARMLWLIVIAAILFPFVLYHPLFTSRWFRHTSQLLSLSAAALNLLLWTALLARPGRDARLLLVSAGLGVAVAGAAIAYGVVQFMSTGWQWTAESFRGVTQVGSLIVWCWAFWPSKREPSPGIEAIPDPS